MYDYTGRMTAECYCVMLTVAATCAFLPGASRQIARSIISWATSTLMNIESG